jgi:DNA-binding MarR family transcriptional regulator
MIQKTSILLTQDLYQIMKRFPRPKLIKSPIEGLTRSEYELLVMLVMNLDQDKTKLSVSDLSNLLLITPAGVTHLLNPLEKAGYIERLQDPKDRRIVLIGITSKGMTAADALMVELQEQLINLINYLGEEDSKTLIHLVSKAIEFYATQY